jgi:NAD(P)-dependent dehydrogenase (short-subunit alcohol dehydrogenase family)
MKTALITGGTKGIGYGIAAAMLNENRNVVITGRHQTTVDEAVTALSKIGKGQVLGVVSDVRNLADEQNAVAKTIEKFGSLDVLIANAGIGHFASIEDLTPEQWQQTIDINLTGVFNSIKAGVEALKQSKGYFITIASLAGTNFFARGAAYNASKFGLVGMTQAIMLDLRQYGIKTTTIMPGSVSTYFNGNEPSADDAWKIQPEDIGQMIIDLLKMHPRTLPSKIEVRPAMPGK